MLICCHCQSKRDDLPQKSKISSGTLQQNDSIFETRTTAANIHKKQSNHYVLSTVHIIYRVVVVVLLLTMMMMTTMVDLFVLFESAFKEVSRVGVFDAAILCALYFTLPMQERGGRRGV
jgi:hypothetical protein